MLPGWSLLAVASASPTAVLAPASPWTDQDVVTRPRSVEPTLHRIGRRVYAEELAIGLDVRGAGPRTAWWLDHEAELADTIWVSASDLCDDKVLAALSGHDELGLYVDGRAPLPCAESLPARVLHIALATPTPEQLATVTAHPGLRSLAVWAPGSADAVVAALGTPSVLRRLHLNGADADVIARISTWPALVDLRLSWSRMSAEDVSALDSLERLTITGWRDLDQDGIEALASLSGLEQLHLDRCIEADLRALHHLGELSALRSLRLDAVGTRGPVDGPTGAHLAFLTDLRKLEELSLRGAMLSDDNLTRIASLPRLRALDLSSGSFDGAGLSALHGLDELERLALGNTPTLGDDLVALPTLPSLRWLDVHSSRVGAAGIGAAAGQPALRELVLSANSPRGEALAGLARATALRRLDLGGHRLDKARVLRRMREIMWLDLSGAELSPEELRQGLRGKRRLVHLDLGDAAVDARVLRSLDRHPDLISLGLRGTETTSEELARLVRHHPALQALDLRQTKIVDADLARLDALPALTWLNLRQTAVSPAAAAAFAAAHPDVALIH